MKLTLDITEEQLDELCGALSNFSYCPGELLEGGSLFHNFGGEECTNGDDPPECIDCWREELKKRIEED